MFIQGQYRRQQQHDNLRWSERTRSRCANLHLWLSAVLPATEFILNHRGYIYANLAKWQIYTVSTTADDDIMIVWFGPLAYSGWTRSNANLESAFPTLNTVTYTANLV